MSTKKFDRPNLYEVKNWNTWTWDCAFGPWNAVHGRTSCTATDLVLESQTASCWTASSESFVNNPTEYTNQYTLCWNWSTPDNDGGVFIKPDSAYKNQWSRFCKTADFNNTCNYATEGNNDKCTSCSAIRIHADCGTANEKILANEPTTQLELCLEWNVSDFTSTTNGWTWKCTNTDIDSNGKSPDTQDCSATKSWTSPQSNNQSNSSR